MSAHVDPIESLVFVDAPDFIAFVPGVPVPGGSKVLGRRNNGTLFVRDAAGKRNALWKRNVRMTAITMMEGPPITGPVDLSVVFVMPRPKKHFFTGKRSNVLRPDAPAHHVHAPDATKLLRSTEDALKGIVWVDDSQVVSQTVMKRYGPFPGARIVVRRINETE